MGATFPPPLVLTALLGQAGCGPPGIGPAAIPRASPPPAAIGQALGSAASHHSVHSNATQASEDSSSDSDPSHAKEDAVTEGEGTEVDKHGTETVSDNHTALDGEGEPEYPPSQGTLAGMSQVIGMHKDTDSESSPYRSSTQKPPRRTNP